MGGRQLSGLGDFEPYLRSGGTQGLMGGKPSWRRAVHVVAPSSFPSSPLSHLHGPFGVVPILSGDGGLFPGDFAPGDFGLYFIRLMAWPTWPSV